MVELIIKRTIIESETERIDLNLWKVPIDKNYPEGVKYSINYRELVNNKWMDKIRIDNKKREGHHLHFLKQKKPYAFSSFENALQDLKQLIEKSKGEK